MADFGFIANEAISGSEIVRFRFNLLRINGGMPYVAVRTATSENTAHHKAGLQLDTVEMRKIGFGKGKRRDIRLNDEKAVVKALEVMDEARERDLDLFPKFVVVDWGLEYRGAGDIEKPFPGSKKAKKGVAFEGPMMDASGPLEPTVENLRDFLKAIWTRKVEDFDELRYFCLDQANFREVVETTELAGNLPSG